MHQNFWYPMFSETLDGSPQCFWRCETKKLSTQNSEIPFLFLCIKFFDTWNILKHWRAPREIFCYCETKNVRRKSVIPLPHLLSIIFFSYQKISETQKGSVTKFFGPVRQKIFDKNMMPPSYASEFLMSEFFETQKGSLTNSFGTVKQRKTTENSDIPLCIKLFDTRNFLKHWRDPLRSFSVLWDKKIFDKAMMPPPLPCMQIFDTKIFFETQKCSPTKFFGTVRQKNLNEKWYPLFCIKYRNQWWNWCL